MTAVVLALLVFRQSGTWKGDVTGGSGAQLVAAESGAVIDIRESAAAASGALAFSSSPAEIIPAGRLQDAEGALAIRIFLPDQPMLGGEAALAENTHASVTDVSGKGVQISALETAASGGTLLTLRPTDMFRPGIVHVRVAYAPPRGIMRHIGEFLHLTANADVLLYEGDAALGRMVMNADTDRYVPAETAHVSAALLSASGAALCGGLQAVLIAPDGETGAVALAMRCASHPTADTLDQTTDLPLPVAGRYGLTVHSTHFATTAPLPAGEVPAVRIHRTALTHIAPGQQSAMLLTVEPSVTFLGAITDSAPAAFRIGADTTVTRAGDLQEIRWDKLWEAGKTYTLRYTFTAPSELTLAPLGPVRIRGELQDATVTASSASAASSGASSFVTSAGEDASSSADSASSASAASSEASSSAGSSFGNVQSSTSSGDVSSADSSAGTESGSDLPVRVSAIESQSSAAASVSGAPADLSFLDVPSVATQDNSAIAFSQEEERTWWMLVAEISPVADQHSSGSKSSSSDERSSRAVTEDNLEQGTAALELTATKTQFEANEAPTFKLLDIEMPQTDGSPLSSETALGTLVSATTPKSVIVQEAAKALIDDGKDVIAQRLALDSQSVTTLRDALGDDAGSSRRSDKLQAAVEDAITAAPSLRQELSAIALQDSAVSDGLNAAVTADLKTRIATAAMADDANARIADILQTDAPETVAAIQGSMTATLGDTAQTAQAIADSVTAPAAPAPDAAPVLTVRLTNAKGQSFTPNYHFVKGSVLLALDPIRTFTPGLYTLTVTVHNPLTNEDQTFTEDFAWGVLAMNPDKDSYDAGDIAHIAFGVLDDRGEIVCTAQLRLTVTAPSGGVQTFTTEDQSIARTGSCGKKQAMFIDPDFEAFLKFTEQGTYHLALTAQTQNGERGISSEIRVGGSAPFTVQRQAATRLWPYGDSPMTLTVRFHQDYSGALAETVPSTFVIKDSTPNAEVVPAGSGTQLRWNGHWRAGQTATFSYVYDAPDISPQFYLLGPLQSAPSADTAAPYIESRAWQIANDVGPVVWDGGGPDANWSTCANWVGDVCPTSTDAVVFNATGKKDATVDASFGGTVASLTIAKTYTGSITLAKAFTTTGNLTHSGTNVTGLTWAAGTESDLHIGGDLLVYSGATVTVKRSSTTGNGSGQSIQVGGNAIIYRNASVTANYQGFDLGSGPGGGGTSEGGTHGGRGGANSDATYGSITDPVSLGSGGERGLGGGAIILGVAGTLTVQGTLSANGGDNSELGGPTLEGGAGGSINIRAATLTGTGTIQANGGNGNFGSGGNGAGGGGRISLGNVTADSFAGTLQANGGIAGVGPKARGFAGTIYLNSAKRSSLAIGGAGNLTSLRLGTDDANTSYTFGTITINNGGTLEIDGNPSMNGSQGGAATLNITTLTVNTGGHISADSLGWGAGYGPGGQTQVGGTYGGRGGDNTRSTYGSITNPQSLGSGGNRNNGGGAVILNVSGTATINGTLSANGEGGLEGGAGGTVNLTLGSLAAGSAAPIQANGGSSCFSCSAGGGGRIAAVLGSGVSWQNLTFSAIAGTPNGAAAAGAAGTIYLKKASQTYGDLIVNNANTDANPGVNTLISSSVTGTTVGSVSVQSGASLKIGTGVMLSVLGTGTVLSTDPRFKNTQILNSGSLILGGTSVSLVNGRLINDELSTVSFVGQANDAAVTVPLLSSGSALRYAHIGFNNPGTTFSLPSTAATLTARGNLTLTGGTLKVTNAQNLALSGSWLNRGTFSAGTGTVTLMGGAQTLSGSTTFYNLTKTVTAPTTLTFAATTTQTVSHALTLQGAASNLLSLRSSQAGTRWRIDPQGARNILYVDVKDGHSINASNIDCPASCVDSGNDIGWFRMYWDGGGSDANWSTAANWGNDAVPVSTDDVFFDARGKKSAVIDASFTGTVNSLTIARTYTGSITLARAFTTVANLTHSGTNLTGLTWTADTESDLHIGGDLLVYSGATVTVKRSSTTGNGSGQSIRVSGNLLVATGAVVSADGQGFASGSGPGGSGSAGGSHGGVGGSGGPATYGSFANPTELGSGGNGGAGGGAIVLGVGGTMIVNGRLSADGDTSTRAGAGGSLNVMAATLTGNGIIRVNGAGGTVVGGGGRIGLGGVTTDTFTGTLQANQGIDGSAYAGTIYLDAGRRNALVLGGAGNLASLRLGSDGTNDYTFGTITVNAGGTLQIGGNPLMNAPNGGAATVGAQAVTVKGGGSLNADGQGFPIFDGPGFGVSQQGASHGGLGAGSLRMTYGSLTSPTSLGSGGSDSAGGGAVILVSTGSVVVNGALSAKGTDNGGSTSHTNGAGGSVNITAATVSGSGSINANGGIEMGGGGRVAVALTSGVSFGSLAFGAYGGTQGNGAAGTVYKKTSIQTYGDLIVNNANVATSADTDTLISGSVTGTSVGTVSVQSGAKLRIASGGTLSALGNGRTLRISAGTNVYNGGTLALNGSGATVSGYWSNTPTSTVRLLGQTDDVTVAIPAVPYGTLRLTNTGTTFMHGSALRVNKNLQIDAGTLSSGVQNVTVRGDWRNSGTYAHGSNTVTFQGSSGRTLLPAGQSFGNIAFNEVPDAWWKLDEAAAGSAFLDSSGYGFNATTSGTSGANSKPQPSVDVPSVGYPDARSFSFDGTDDMATTGTGVYALDGNMTAMAWIKLNAVTAGTMQVVEQASRGDQQNFSLEINRQAGKLSAIWGDQQIIFSNANLSAGTWYHVALVRSGSRGNWRVTLYINGASDNSTTTPYNPNATSDREDTIGSLKNANGDYRQFFDGKIDDVRLYTRALTASEISAVAGGSQYLGSDVTTLGSALSASGSLTIRGDALDVSGADYGIALGGDWTNGGTFVKRSGTVRLTGTGQTLSGSTVFQNLTKSGSLAATLTFDPGSRVSVSGALTLRGGSSTARLALRSATSGTQARLVLDGDSGTQSLANLNVKDHDASGGATLSCGTSCVNAGNVTNWSFPITGTLYTDAGITAAGPGHVIAASVNGGTATTATTDGSGQFTLTSVNASSGSVITVYVDGEAAKALRVHVTDGTSFDASLYQSNLILSSALSGVPVTNAGLAVADNNGDTDITDVYIVTGSDVTVTTGNVLYVSSGSEYRPGGNVAADDVTVRGRLTMAANSLNVSGSLDATGGSFTTSGTTTFDAASPETVTSNGSKFQNVTFQNTAGTWTAQDRLAASGALTITAGALDLHGHALGNRGGAYSNRGTLRLLGSETLTGFTNDTASGTTLFYGSGAYAGLSGLTSFAHVGFSGSGLWNLASTVTVAKSLTLTGGTLDVTASNYGIRVGGSWTDLAQGSFVPRSGTVQLLGTGSINARNAFGNLTVDATGATVTGLNTLNVDGNLLLQRGTFRTPSPTSVVTLAGNWTKKAAASVVAGSGTVTLDGLSQTLSGSTTFYNLAKTTATAATLTFAAGTTQTVRHTWTAAGAASNLLSLRSSRNGTQWKIDPQNTRTLSFVDVKDSNDINAATVLCANDCINSGNNGNWAFPMTVTVYSDSGTTLMGSGITVAVAVNGGAKTTARTNGLSVATFTTVGLTAGDVVTMWLDDDPAVGAAVTVTNGTTLGFDIYQDYLIARQEQGSSITNAHFDTANNVNDGDLDAIYTMSGTTMTMQPGKTLLIRNGSTLSLTGKLNVDDIVIKGVLAMGAQNMTVAGSWSTQGGSFTGTNTVTFDTDSPETISSNGSSFRNVTFVVSGTSAQWVTTDTLSVSGNQIVQNPSGSTDTTAPVISNVRAGVVAETGAVITWDTNESATSKVVYGTSSGALTSSAILTTFNLSHAIILDSLAASTLYYYRAVSTDIAGNTATGSVQTFTTHADSAGIAAGAAASAAAAVGGGGLIRPYESCTPERIAKNFLVSDVIATPDAESGSVRITWKTNKEALSLAGIGTEAPSERWMNDLTHFVTDHAVTLTALRPGTVYRFQVASFSACGELTASDIGTFTMPPASAAAASEAAASSAAAESLSSAAASSSSQPPDVTLADLSQQYYALFDKVSNQLTLQEIKTQLAVQSDELRKRAFVLPGPRLAGEPKVTVTDTSAVIEWTTDDAATSRVSFSPDKLYQSGSYLQSAGSDSSYVTNHRVSIIGLQPGMRYHYRVQSTTQIGSETLSRDFAFLTSQEAVAILNYAADVLTPNSARFRWQTSVPASTEVTVTPYRNGTPQTDSAHTFHGDSAALKHEMTVSEFDPGVLYDVEIWGKTDAGIIVSKTVARFATSADAAAIEIQNVQTNTAISPGKDSKIQAVVTWNTNYDATSRVSFQQGVNSDAAAAFASATPTDESYTRNHVVVLPALEPGQIYSFQVESADSNGKPVRSHIFTLLTPRQEEGIFQVILKQFEGAFGWIGQLKGGN